MRTPDDPLDLVTLREAASLTGRSPDTLRRWKRERGLLDYRDRTDPTSPSRVSKAQLLAIAATVADAVQGRQAPPRASTRASSAPPVGSQAVVAAMQAHLVGLEGERDDLRRQRDALTEELRAVRRELETLRSELRDRDTRVAALEAEINNGVRGLLRDAARRLRW